jgi:hypothetical protein
MTLKTMSNTACGATNQMPRETPQASGLSKSLRNLDDYLLRRVSALRDQTGREPGCDPFRGLYIEESDVRLLFTDATPALRQHGPLAEGSNFAGLASIYGLTARDLDVLLIALAPELDSRYERIYAYLQDDVSRKRPSIELIISLLIDSSLATASAYEWFGGSNALRRYEIIRVSDDSVPMARREVSVHPRIAAYLCGIDEIDDELSSFCRPIRPEAFRTTLCSDPGIVRLAGAASNRHSHLVFNFLGENEAAKRDSALGLAAHLALSFIEIDLDRLARNVEGIEIRLRALARESTLQPSLVLCRGIDRLSDNALRESILNRICETSAVTVVISHGPWHGDDIQGIIALRFGIPEWSVRRQAWHSALKKRGLRIRASALDRLAGCFRFTEAQVYEATQAAAKIASYRDQPVREEHLFEAARSHSGHAMGDLARKVQPVHEWGDIVLPDEVLSQLHEICRRVVFRHQVLGDWGFERKLSGGIGVNALFHGHAGTGKTMAAEVVAKELRLDLYKIDLAGIVSKYIGETEKNLDRIFEAATTANAILFFDEADALFGKRSEVRDSHDRYANLEISYLLQKMEQYEGVAILATNLRQNLDDAFLRRLAFSINFPFPDEASRRRIWSQIWPRQTPLAADVDLDWLAEHFLLSGGHIRNAALAAAFLATEHNGPVAMADVLSAVRAEFQKMGKTFTTAELEPPIVATLGALA